MTPEPDSQSVSSLENATEENRAANQEESRKESQEESREENREESREEEGHELVRFGVSMPAALVRELDAWRKQQGYANRSEAVRDLVRDALVEARWQDDTAENTEMVGVVTVVYNHAAHQVSENLIQMQHHHHEVSQATLHIHLSSDHCLEVTVLRGNRTDVTHMAEHMISARGVLHGKFVPTTTGQNLL